MSPFTPSLISAILDNYDFSPISQMVDVGNGHNLLMAEILKANPTMKGVLCNCSPLVERVQHLLKAKGVAERCELVGESFSEAAPRGGDAYLIQCLSHDWDTAPALTLLKKCRQAMAENGKLLLLETVISANNPPSSGKWVDLALFLMTGGRERQETEYRELLATAGFKLTKVIHTLSCIDIVEAVKV